MEVVRIVDVEILLVFSAYSSQSLIDHEIDQLRQFIGDAKVVELQKQVEQVEQADAVI